MHSAIRRHLARGRIAEHRRFRLWRVSVAALLAAFLLGIARSPGFSAGRAGSREDS